MMGCLFLVVDVVLGWVISGKQETALDTTLGSCMFLSLFLRLHNWCARCNSIYRATAIHIKLAYTIQYLTGQKTIIMRRT